MVIEISLNGLIRLCRFASLGKVIEGLLHNINGPLQNLGMDIEMMNNSLAVNEPLHDALAKDIDIQWSRMDAIMYIDACHSNGCPLKLQELLEPDDTNFAHDVFGIRRHINRKTGKLENCFVPRYAG